MSDSTSVQDFKLSVFRAFEAAAREAGELRNKVDGLALKQAADSVRIETAGEDSEKIRALEIKVVDPERIRALETKVTQLEVRSAIIGAITGGAAAILIPLAVKYFTH